MGKLRELSEEDLVAEMQAALDELAKRAPDQKIGAIGFCFGGGMVWQLIKSGDERLAAAAPFYGTTPDSGADFTKSKAAVHRGVRRAGRPRERDARDARRRRSRRRGSSTRS